MDRPHSALRHVRLGNRVARVGGAAFRWYMAGKMAAFRSEFMRSARQKKQDGGYGVSSAVANARHYHHEYMREIARALDLS